MAAERRELSGVFVSAGRVFLGETALLVFVDADVGDVDALAKGGKDAVFDFMPCVGRGGFVFDEFCDFGFLFFELGFEGV